EPGVARDAGNVPPRDDATVDGPPVSVRARQPRLRLAALALIVVAFGGSAWAWATLRGSGRTAVIEDAGTIAGVPPAVAGVGVEDSVVATPADTIASRTDSVRVADSTMLDVRAQDTSGAPAPATTPRSRVARGQPREPAVAPFPPAAEPIPDSLPRELRGIDSLTRWLGMSVARFLIGIPPVVDERAAIRLEIELRRSRIDSIARRAAWLDSIAREQQPP
ncbi:MAG: hypothetical protein M3373_02990, partial [Gemmatimonadota bacterium]|nr:hypothetical protein [Gemmatimonadota bacterium]